MLLLLPPEIIPNIFVFLTPLQLCNLCSICKQLATNFLNDNTTWKNICQDLCTVKISNNELLLHGPNNYCTYWKEVYKWYRKIRYVSCNPISIWELTHLRHLLEENLDATSPFPTRIYRFEDELKLGAYGDSEGNSYSGVYRINWESDENYSKITKNNKNSCYRKNPNNQRKIRIATVRVGNMNKKGNEESPIYLRYVVNNENSLLLEFNTNKKYSELGFVVLMQIVFIVDGEYLYSPKVKAKPSKRFYELGGAQQLYRKQLRFFVSIQRILKKRWNEKCSLQ